MPLGRERVDALVRAHTGDPRAVPDEVCDRRGFVFMTILKFERAFAVRR